MAVAQLGGAMFVYVDDHPPPTRFWFSGVANPITAQRVVSIAFRNEGYAKPFNSVPSPPLGYRCKLEEI